MCRAASSRTDFYSIAARRCRSPSATWSTRSRWWTPMASTRFAIFSGPKFRWGGRADDMIAQGGAAMKTQHLHQVLIAVWAVVAEANRYFAGEAPWALAKTDPARQGTILYVTAEVLRQIAILALPFTPASADRLL